MSKTKVFLAGATMIFTLFAMSPAAQAKQLSGPGEVQRVRSKVVVDQDNPGVAYVTVKYRCEGGSATHLWVSVKQGGPDPTAEGSSSTVDAWYDTHPLDVRCNDKWQTQTFTLERHATDFGGRPLGYLTNDPVWVQFCLFPNAGDFETLVYQYQWNSVKFLP